jgi:hypothetical protein
MPDNKGHKRLKTVVEAGGGPVRYNMGTIAGVMSENPTNDLVTSQFIDSNQASSFGVENRGHGGLA